MKKPTYSWGKPLKDHLSGGVSDNSSISDFNPESLSQGTEVEMEHTDNPEIAQEISRDHLSEDPNYYNKLATIHKGEDWKSQGYTLEHWIDRDGFHNVAAMSPDKRQVGYTSFTYDYIPNETETGLVPGDLKGWDLYVHPEHRRKGLATAMYKLAEEKSGKKIQQSGSLLEDGKSFWDQPNRPFGKSEESHIINTLRGTPDKGSFDKIIDSVKGTDQARDILSYVNSHNSSHGPYYHGTPRHKEIQESGFKNTVGHRSGIFGSNRQVQNLGNYITNDRALAHHYGSNRSSALGGAYEIISVTPQVSNTLDLTSGKMPKHLLSHAKDILSRHDGKSRKNIQGNDIVELLDNPDFVGKLKESNYDSVKFKEQKSILKDAKSGGHTLFVMNPENLSVKKPIKSLDDLHEHFHGKPIAKNESLEKNTANDLEKQAHELMGKGDWKNAIKVIKRIPSNWDFWQRIPSFGYEMSNDTMMDLINHAPKHGTSFGFELASNLPDHTSSEVLNALGDKYGHDDHYVLKNIQSHPNFKLSPEKQSLANAGKFWNSYEKQVEPRHFSTVKSLLSGKPETFNDFRSKTSHTNEDMDILPSLLDHANHVHKSIIKDDWIKKKYIKGEPHIQVFRGVGGDYAKNIKQLVGYNHESDSVKSGKVKIPTAPLSSWSTDSEVAARFAHGRGSIEGQEPGHGVVFSKWVPLKDVIHSGMHKVVFNQEQAHPSENEIVLSHKDPHYEVHTKDIYFQKPHHQYGQVDKANVVPSRAKKIVKSEESDISKGAKGLALGLSLFGAVANTHSPVFEPKQTVVEEKKDIKQMLGSHPVDKFLHNIMQVETSGGKNLNHPLINYGMHKGHRAVGHFALMPLTIKEIAKRHVMSGGEDPEITKINNIPLKQIASHVQGNPKLELKLARGLANHVIKKFGDNHKAAYAWKYGHNTKKSDLPHKSEMLKDQYIRKFNMLQSGEEVHGLKPASVDSDLNKAVMLQDYLSDRIGRRLDMTRDAFKHAPHEVHTNKLKNGLFHHVVGYGNNESHFLSTSPDHNDDDSYLARLDGDKDYEHGLKIDMSGVKPEHKGKGYGKTLYLSALAHHGKLASDSKLTRRSNAVWEFIPKVTQGMAQVNLANLVRLSEDENHPDYHTFHTAKADKDQLQSLLFDKSFKKNESNDLKKMSTGLPNFKKKPKVNSRPDQEVQNIDTTRQANMFAQRAAENFKYKKNKYMKESVRDTAKVYTKPTSSMDYHRFKNSFKQEFGIDVPREQYENTGVALGGGQMANPVASVKGEGKNPSGKRREHEGIHHLFNDLANKYGQDVSDHALDRMNEIVHPDVLQHLKTHMTQIGYSDQSHRKELLPHLYEMLNDPSTRNIMRHTNPDFAVNERDIMTQAKKSWRDIVSFSKKF